MDKTIFLDNAKLFVIASALSRALAERKFRLVLRRPNSLGHLPEILKLTLFHSDAKDHMDGPKCIAWQRMFQKMDTLYQDLRQVQTESAALLSLERELLDYDKKLAQDIERAAGGGLVRTLGGSKAARNKLDETRSQLQEVKAKLKQRREHTEELKVNTSSRG